MTTPFRALLSACGAHGIQDGLVAVQYVLYPILATTLGLSYAQVGVLRACTNTAMSVFEIPSGLMAERTGIKPLMVFGLACAGAGFLGVSQSSTFLTIAIFLTVAGLGAAFQHSLSSALLVEHFEDERRRSALGTYNAAGDAGKLAFTGLFSLGLGAGLAWNTIVTIMAIASIGFGVAIWFMLRSNAPVSTIDTPSDSNPQRGWGIIDPARFWGVGIAVLLDSAVQAVFLTFIAFVMLDKGAPASLASAAVVLVLAGGMVGKFVCGFIAARLGDRVSFALIQALTIAGFITVIYLPWATLMFGLPLIGLVVQGSSTICYGSVADFVDKSKQSRGYSLIYTLGSASSVFGPLGFGFIADTSGLDAAVWALAAATALTIPLSIALTGKLHRTATNS